MTARFSTGLRSFLVNSGICAVLFGVILAAYYLFPVQYVHLIAEDTPAEYATTTAYLAGCFLLLWAMIRNRDARTMMCALLLLFMFFVGMEEISWGHSASSASKPPISSWSTITSASSTCTT